MLLLFSLSIFLGAGLLFLVQPMVGKMLLPLLGGSPGVWNTCMVFFQAALLAGYLYAHLLTLIRSAAAQLIIHALVLIGAAALLPIGFSPAEQLGPGEEPPIGWLLRVLLSSVGAPFFAIASAGPLLQKWFAQTSHPHAKDPYFLYAASNLGSMLALLGYPFLIEPSFGLANQRLTWSIGYAVFGILAVACGLWMAREARRPQPISAPASEKPQEPVDPGVAAALTTRVTSWMRLRWVFLAFVPSSLMLGCTQYIATDIASFPLLWVIPLSIYLLSFIIAFSRLGRPIVILADWLLPLAAVALTLLLYKEPRFNMGLIVAPHIAGLLVVALVCHGRLAAERPDASRLTEFYLWIAVGGVLGGAFNSLAAPFVFTDIAEYPIAITLACLARPWRIARGAKTAIHEWWVRFNGALDIMVPVAIGAIFIYMPAFLAKPAGQWLVEQAAWLLNHTVTAPSSWWWFKTWWPWVEIAKPEAAASLAMGVPAVLSLIFARQRVRFAGCVAALALMPFVISDRNSHLVHAERTFFGVYRVFEYRDSERDATWRYLHHGRTMHGDQLIQEPWSLEPSSYYTHPGPVGDLFNMLAPRKDLHAAFIGMGTGTLAAYGTDGWTFDFYEIDPTVTGISAAARGPDAHTWFSYIHDSRAAVTWNHLGDARLTLKKAPPASYDAMFFDAFSSDAIPVHLLTREAIEMYLQRLKPGGVLVFHITNGYLDLEPVLAAAARDLSLVARHRDYSPGSGDTRGSACDWLIMGRRPEDLGGLYAHDYWVEPKTKEGVHTWTDDYSNLLRVFKW